MRLKWFVFCVLIFTLVFSSFSPIKSRNSCVLPNYFIAIHNEPFNVDTQLNSNGDELRKQSLSVLTDMTDYAYERGIKLTLMFSPQWISLLMEEKNQDLISTWKDQGHDISAHHHGIRHMNWDGYTNYSEETAQKQRLQQLHSPDKQIINPESYIGTLSDAMKEWKIICPDIHTGCMNAEFDKNEIPYGVNIDTSSGFMNSGMIGVRKKNDNTSPKIGVNDYILEGSVNDQTISWLSHFLPGPNQSILPELISTMSSCSEKSSYGLVFHSSSQELPMFKKCLDFIHENDSLAVHSYTLKGIVDSNLVPTKILPASFLGVKNNIPNNPPPIGLHPGSINKVGFAENGFAHAYNLGINMTREGVYAFWPLVQPDLDSSFYNFKLYDNQWFDIPTNITILANISAQPSKHDYERLLPGSWLPVDIPSYQKFVKAVVERFDGDGYEDMPGLTNPIKYWQVGNEPNALMPRLTDYAKYQQITYEAIKEANPEAIVIMGGVAGFPYRYMESFRNFYSPILQELNGKYVDVFDFHWYGNAFGDYRMIDLQTNEVAYKEIRQTLTENGFSETLPLWITEMGTYSGLLENPPIWNSYQSEENQATDLVKRCFYSWAIGVDQVLMAFGLMEGFKHNAGYFDHTGFIYDGEGIVDYGLGTKKLGYFTLKLITQEFDGLIISDLTLVRDDKQISILRWDNPDGDVKYILWRNDNPGYLKPDMQIELDSKDMFDFKNVTVTEMVPNAFIGKDLEKQDFDSIFKTNEIKPTETGEIVISVNAIPLMISCTK